MRIASDATARVTGGQFVSASSGGVRMIRRDNTRRRAYREELTRRGISLNKMFEEFSARALADAEVRFLARAARGDTRAGLALLDKLDAHDR